MTNLKGKTTSKDLEHWSCEDKWKTIREGFCRNPNGCHCREITKLVNQNRQLKVLVFI